MPQPPARVLISTESPNKQTKPAPAPQTTSSCSPPRFSDDDDDDDDDDDNKLATSPPCSSLTARGDVTLRRKSPRRCFDCRRGKGRRSRLGAFGARRSVTIARRKRRPWRRACEVAEDSFRSDFIAAAAVGIVDHESPRATTLSEERGSLATPPWSQLRATKKLASPDRRRRGAAVT